MLLLPQMLPSSPLLVEPIWSFNQVQWCMLSPSNILSYVSYVLWVT
ncbi:unnamed protein product [Brassica napus]|uniref:(rape) hypothetical protein n=1 Tax=Brassica napus TaxID=3708 RepID=A0A816YFD8_BRANA|nr:unnamed protein product [Brassica napus]